MNSSTTSNFSEIENFRAAEVQAEKYKDQFFPTGAIVFFITLVLLCLAIWFGIYFIMIERV